MQALLESFVLRGENNVSKLRLGWWVGRLVVSQVVSVGCWCELTTIIRRTYFWRPYALCVSARHLLIVIELAAVVLGDLLAQLPRQPGQPDRVRAVHRVADRLGRPGENIRC